jgi:hypothetical protein
MRLIPQLSGLPYVISDVTLVRRSCSRIAVCSRSGQAILDTLSVLLYPFAMSTLLPVLLYTLVLEREARILPFMLAVGAVNSSLWFSLFCSWSRAAAGLRMKPYVFSYYVFSMTFYIAIAFIFVVAGVIMQVYISRPLFPHSPARC